MKRFGCAIFLVILFAHPVIAQKSAVTQAWNHYKFDELDKAKKLIDQACGYGQTKAMPKTWYYAGLIYQNIAAHKYFSTLDPLASDRAIQFFNKCLELDKQGEFETECRNHINQILFQKGAEKFNNKNFFGAYSDFCIVCRNDASDMLAKLYVAYSADHAGLKEEALGYYRQLIELNYADKDPDSTNIYLEAAYILKNDLKDTAGALDMITKGRIRYPATVNLIREEAQILLVRGKYNSAIFLLTNAIKLNERESVLHFLLANAYEGLYSESPAGTINPNSAEQLAEVEEHYRRAIDIRPDYFEANYNLGAMYFNKAADFFNKSNSFQEDKDFRDFQKKAEEMLKKAKPFLEKANEINPKDRNTLISLKQIYIRTGEVDKFNRINSALNSN